VSVFDGLPDVFAATFGEAVVITPVGGEARTITAVFRREADRDGAFDRSGQVHVARLSARAADVHDMTDGAEVTAGGADWLAGAPGFDGRGMAVMDLRRT